MSKDLFMYAYKMKSEGAVKLQKVLGISQIKHEGTTVKGKPDRFILNWGSGKMPADLLVCHILNHPYDVLMMINKINSYELLEHYCRTPDWTTSKSTAKKWLHDGHSVLCRTVTQGKAGEGITIAKKPEDIIDAKVYCKVIEKDKEFRVHVFGGKVLGYQIRVKNPEATTHDPEVCTMSHGWQLKNLITWTPPEDVTRQALLAIERSGLTFGAVDVCFAKDGKGYVFEINTAPWLNDNYAEKYADAVTQYINEASSV